MDIKTIILLSIGIIVIFAMCFIIWRDSKPSSTNKSTQQSSKSDIVIDDQSESNYETIEDTAGDGEEESVYDSN